MGNIRPLVDGEFIAKVATIVILAGAMADRFREESALETQCKSQGNFVTKADIAVEDYLKKQLGELDTQIGFIAEESIAEVTQQCFWAIDPIDGTGNYLVGLPYSVSVALMDNNISTLAMVLDPQRNELWWAVRGKGAHRLSGASSCVLSDYTTLVNLSDPITIAPSSPDEGNVLFGMPYDRTKAHSILGYVEALFKNADDIKRIGPASLDICRVAAGQAKLYLEFDLKIWDYAAGELVLYEAGGTSLHFDGLSLFGTKNAVEWARKALSIGIKIGC